MAWRGTVRRACYALHQLHREATGKAGPQSRRDVQAPVRIARRMPAIALLCLSSARARHRQSMCAGHAPALIGTPAAGGSAILAVLHLVLCAFVGAHVANRRARGANRFCSIAAPCHHRCGYPAQLRAIDIERDAAGHHLDVVFLQASRRAHVASIGAIVTGFDAGFVLLVHDVLLQSWVMPRFRTSGRCGEGYGPSSLEP